MLYCFDCKNNIEIVETGGKCPFCHSTDIREKEHIIVSINDWLI